MRQTRAALPKLLALLWLASPAAAASDGLAIEGPALGTRYAVRVAPPDALTQAELRDAVKGVLSLVDAAFSTWRADSEISRFNRSRETSWIDVSDRTARVAGAARALALRSEGAFDPTVGPLVRLWGFGAEAVIALPPRPEALAEARAAVGFTGFHVREAPPALRKERPELELDLSGIAKGYAADAVVARLREEGVEHCLVELGGEVRALGLSPRGDAWIVEIEDPGAALGEPPLRVALRDAALATSGPYRNFVVSGGERRPHVFDPRRGAPLESPLLSVSVLAPTAMAADAWATALLVAGPESGWELAKREQLAALFVKAAGDGARRRATAAFRQHVLGHALGEERP